MEFINNKLYSDSSLVSYYRFEGNSNDSKGTFNGTDTDINYGDSYGKFSNGISLNGTTSKIDLGTKFDYVIRTYAIWCKAPTTNGGYPFCSRLTGGQGIDLLIAAANVPGDVKLRITTSVGAYETPICHVDETLWHHYLCTINETTLIAKLYIDGKLVCPLAFTGTITDSMNCYLGHRITNASYLNCYLDEFIVFNRELTAFEVYGLYSGQYPLELKETPLYNDSSLIGLWRLEGNNTDSKGGLACTDYNVTYGAAKFGQGAIFNGGSSRIDVANSTNYDVTNLTMSAWVYSTNYAHNGFIFEKGSVNTQYSMFFEGANFVFRTMPSAGGAYVNLITTSTSLGITNNNWHHIVCTYDGGIKRVYVNGQLRVSAVYTAGLMTGKSGERIGAYGGVTPSYWFNGSIDDVAVFNRALSDKEILGLYEGTLAKYSKNTLSKYRKDRFVGYKEKTIRLEDNPLFSDPNLIGYWKLDGNSTASKGSTNGTDTAISYLQENDYFGKPAYFNGTSSYITVGDQAINSNDFTLSCWAKRMSNSTTDYVFGKGTTATADYSLHAGIRSTHEITLAFYGDDLNSGGLYSEINSWHLITFTYTYATKTKNIYYDGLLVATGVGTGNPAWGTASLYLGYSPFSATTFFHGYIADVAVFNRVLTANEIYTLRYSVSEQNNLKDYKRLENNEVNPEIEEGELISPTDIYGCKVWIDVSKINHLVDGNAISSAPDLSGNGNNLAQITAPQNPIYKTNILNGLATMRGTIAATTTFLIPWTYLSPSSIFYIARQTSSNGRLLSGRTNNWLMGYHGGYKDRAYYEGWIDEAVNRQATNSSWYVWNGICDTTSYLMENGKVVKYGTTGVTSPAGMCIGYLGASEFSDFDIGEVIGYNRKLSFRERELVSNYLLKKWGLDYNVAFEKKTVLGSSGITYPILTDGDMSSSPYIGDTAGLKYIEVDLGKVYNCSRVDIFHYWADARTYYYNKINTSPDGVTWTTRFDSEVNGRYTETYEGKTITFTTSPIRYIRNYLNGSSANTGNHWTEIRVMGK